MRQGIPKEKLNFLSLFVTMLLVCLVVSGSAITILYQTAFKEEQNRLKEHAESQANLMDAVARFDARHSTHDHPGGAMGASISQIKDAHEKFDSFGQSGEFLIGKLVGDEIHFLFSHQRHHRSPLSPVPMNSSVAEPMRRALLGQNGTMVGPDYRNIMVLAAYHSVKELQLGIVVKIDLAEIRAPYIHAGIQVFVIAIFAITLGALFFFRISNPIITQIRRQTISLREYADQINNANTELKLANAELNQEISHREQMTEALQIREEQFRLLLNSTSEGIYGLDTSGRCTFINTAALNLLGYKQDSDLLHKNMHDIIHHTNTDGSPMPETECKIYRAFQSGQGCCCNDELLWRADGSSFAAEYWSYPIKDSEGQSIGAVVTFFDITERKTAEQKLQTSLHEKETLLKEVHHRVKNNMQIISSLLALQTEQATTIETKDVLEECRGRVRTMALIHEKLYRSSDLGSIDFADYLHDLTTNLNRGQLTKGNCITITIRADHIFLPVDTAIPCGLIVNELVTNAIKHGFDTNDCGTIEIDFHQHQQKLCLTVSDTGCGMSPDFDIEKSDTFGLRLIANLVRQLEGTLEYRTDNGFACTFCFKTDAQEGRDG